jgi:hypothetical protein
VAESGCAVATKRTHVRAEREWSDFCLRHGLPDSVAFLSMEDFDDAVAAFLQFMLESGRTPGAALATQSALTTRFNLEQKSSPSFLPLTQALRLALRRFCPPPLPVAALSPRLFFRLLQRLALMGEVRTPFLVAGFVLGFAALLRPSEFSVPSLAQAEEWKRRGLRNSDLAFEVGRDGRSRVRISIRKRKNLQNDLPHLVYLVSPRPGEVGVDLVEILRQVHRPANPSAPLLWEWSERGGWRPLMTATIREVLKSLVASERLDAALVSAMSLRVSGASALSAAGWQLEQIRVFGGWKSLAVLRYIRSAVITLDCASEALHRAALADAEPRVAR